MFHSARIKLTAWYLLIIMSVSLFFSGVIYNVLSTEVKRFATKQRYSIVHGLDKSCDIIPTRPIDPDLVEETHQRILILLGVINGVIFVASGFLGYMLAGKTLLPIQEMVDSQNRFISDASHELRTPLTSLKSAMEVSLRDPQFKILDAKKLIKESILEVNKIQTLAESLLQLAQYQARNGHTHFEKLVLNHILESVLKKMEPLARLKHIHIENKTINLSLKGNSDSLTELFVILLDNAIKYSPTKSAITITSKSTHRLAFIEVQDQGIGIKAKELPYIFDRFYRSDTARSKSGNSVGYGLGLSIAKKIVDIHKGSITVKSTVGKGTIFTIKLPLHQSKK